MLLTLLVIAVLLQGWAWQRLRKRLLRSEMTRLGASFRYGGWAALPFLLLVGAFLGMVGIEELTGSAIIPEPMARVAVAMSLLMLGIAVLGWASFSIYCALIGRGPAVETENAQEHE